MKSTAARQRFALMWCDTCGRVTRGSRPGLSPRRHLVLSAVTFGLWLPAWLAGAVRQRSEPFTCRYCGSRGRAIDPPHREIVSVSVALAVVVLLAVLAMMLVRGRAGHQGQLTGGSRSATLASSTSRAIGLGT